MITLDCTPIQMLVYSKVLSVMLLILEVFCVEYPGTCKVGQYYNADQWSCEYCAVNASLITSEDGFGCVCDRSSITEDTIKCSRCNATEMPTRDRSGCVPRRCQKDKSGRLACRRCPAGYISVTQNYDGSPMREVQCVKCAKGYKAIDDRCERCIHCSCQRNETLVKDVCVLKGFISTRPKPENGRFHPSTILEVIKNEHLCLRGDRNACRNLTNQCVKSLYNSEQGGPCRLWFNNKPSVLPQLNFDSFNMEQNHQEELNLAKGQKSLLLVSAAYTRGGGIEFRRNPDNKSKCLLPISIHIGSDFTSECSVPLDHLFALGGDSLGAYVDTSGSLYHIPITIRTPSGRKLQKGSWPTDRFRRYILVDKFLDPSTNLSSIIYLRSLIIRMRVKRDESRKKLRIKISLDAHYSKLFVSEKVVFTSLRVECDLPGTGIRRALEIWGSVLGAIAVLYAAFMWRGTIRRGGSQFAIVPLVAGSLADALFMAAWCTTIHALAAEVITTGLPLPLSKTEELTVEAFIYSALGLKVIRVLWINWYQSRVDIFLLDWSDYNYYLTNRDIKEHEIKGNSGVMWVIREFATLQTIRRATPMYTVPITLLILRAFVDVHNSLPDSPAYLWAFSVSMWLCAYFVVLVLRWLRDKTLGSPASNLLAACRGTNTSLIIFQEEFYAHYVHGRNDVMSDTRSFIGPLAAGRVVCVPQLRQIIEQLSTPIPGNLDDTGARRALLSKFLAAFFERALDGLGWVASERTLFERLFDVELSARESGNTSAILYDPDDSMPSIITLTWWGEEWNLASFDVLLFGCVLLTTTDSFVAGFVCLFMWQILKWFCHWIRIQNIRRKTEVQLFF